MSSTSEAYQKVGAGHLKAMGFRGLHELQGLIYPESNVAPPIEYGIFGNPTPGEIADARRPDERDLYGEAGSRSIIADRVNRAGRDDGREPPEKDRE